MSTDDKIAPQIRTKYVSEVRAIGVNFTNDLKGSALLSGANADVVEVTTSDLTISNQGINAAEIEINDRKVATGKAVVALIAGGTAGTRYTLKVGDTTDESPAQALLLECLLDVIADPT